MEYWSGGVHQFSVVRELPSCEGASLPILSALPPHNINPTSPVVRELYFPCCEGALLPLL